MLRRHALTIAFCLAAGSIPALGPIASAAAPPAPPPVVEQTFTARGVVTDAVTGNPLGGACVNGYATNYFAPLTRVCTGPDGKYEIPGFPRASFRFSASAPGYPTQWWPSAVDLSPTMLPPPANSVKQLDFALTTATTALAGTIRRQDGSPAPYAQVSLYRFGTTIRVAFFVAGLDGTFHRSNIPPGDYQLQTSWSAYPAQWHPNATSQAGAGKVSLAEGAITTVNEQFLPLPQMPNRTLVTLTGRVTDSGGNGITGATVTVRDLANLYAEVTTDAGGNYATPLIPPGTSMSVAASAPGRAPVWAPESSLPRTATIGTNNPVINLMLPDQNQVGTLRGRAGDFDGSAAPFRTLLNLYRNEQTITTSVQVGQDGSYEIPNVPAGQYRISISNSPRSTTQFYPAAQNWSGGETITITAGQVTEVNPVLIGPGWVHATVQDEQTAAPSVGTCLYAYISPTVCTGEDGTAIVGPIWLSKPASVDVVAQWNGFHWTYSKQADVSSGAITPVQFRVRLGAVIDLAVPEWNGHQHTGPLCVRPEYPGFGRDWQQPICLSPSAGRLRVGPFEPGTANIFVEGTPETGAQWIGPNSGVGSRAEAVVAILEKGKVTPMPSLLLDRPGAITGTIRGTDGSPLAGACVSTDDSGWVGACADSEGRYLLTGLGPYRWDLRYSYSWNEAVEWSGDASSRSASKPVQVVAGGTQAAPEVRLGRTAILTGLTVPQGSGRLEAYDARTGDLIFTRDIFSEAAELYSLNTGPVAIRYTGNGESCWLHSGLPSRAQRRQEATSPYFTAYAGRSSHIGLTIQPGVNCLPEEPAVLEPIPRKTVTPSSERPQPMPGSRNNLHFGAWVQAEIARLFG